MSRRTSVRGLQSQEAFLRAACSLRSDEIVDVDTSALMKPFPCPRIFRAALSSCSRGMVQARFLPYNRVE